MIKVFTTWKIDLEPYKDETLKHLNTIEKQYISTVEFNKLTDHEQTTLVTRFLSENMVEPFQLLWKARARIFNHPEGVKCAESLMCHLNAHMKKQGPVKQFITKVFSLGASYVWTVDENGLDRWKLYQAIWNAYAPETDCSVQYTPSGKENICHIFHWQDGMMSLNFEHTEL